MEGRRGSGYETMEPEAGSSHFGFETKWGRVKHNDEIDLFRNPYPGGQSRMVGPLTAKAITVST
jgi:hypothetical protein